MRALFVLLLLACAGRASATPDGAKRENTRGMTLMAGKQWADAEAAFEQAVAADASSVTAHYNLACAASRAHDGHTALVELAWIGDRGFWDDAAHAASMKAKRDPDLAWIFSELPSAQNLVGDAAAKVVAPLLTPAYAAAIGQPIADPDKARLAAFLATMAGKHDANCDPKSEKQGKVFGLNLKTGAFANLLGTATLRDGVALVDAKGVIQARSEPLGCTGPGESQDQLSAFAVLEGQPVTLDAPLGRPEEKLEWLAVEYTLGGKRDWHTNVAVFAMKGEQLVKVFEATTVSSDAATAGHAWLTGLGRIVVQLPGEAKKRPFAWDAKAFRFVPVF
ncbi:MAG TPA: hypothetical protein VGM88_26015 [Kofleriaceae bacterium]|jgi:hypothetical protein